jgi:hypothetical protein
MSRQLSIALICCLFLSAASVWASDGDVLIFAQIPGTGSARHQGAECDHWLIKWNDSSEGASNPFGTCQAPVLKVYAVLQGASAQGITGVEFSIKIGPDVFADPGYVLVEVPAPGPTLTLGAALTPPDPDPRGVNMIWETCQTSPDNRILLETVLVIATIPCGPSQRPPELELTVGQHSFPTNRFFRCPLFTLCDGPVFTKVCLGDDIVQCQTQAPPFPNDSQCSTSGRFSINGPGGVGSCKVAQAPEALPNAATDRSWGQVKSLYR